MPDSNFFVHDWALVDTGDIGPGTRIWAFSHVMKGARVGANTNIGEGCFVESGVAIGSEVVIKNGVSIWEGVTIADRVFIGPNAVFTNDAIPRAKIVREHIPTEVAEGASIGANATIVCGHRIGRWALVGAGAVVTRDVSDFALVTGNPARIRGYVCRCGERLSIGGDAQVRCRCGRCYDLVAGRLIEIPAAQAVCGIER